MKFSRSLAGVAKMVRLTKLLGTQSGDWVFRACTSSAVSLPNPFPVHSHTVRQRNLAHEKVTLKTSLGGGFKCLSSSLWGNDPI